MASDNFNSVARCQLFFVQSPVLLVNLEIKVWD